MTHSLPRWSRVLCLLLCAAAAPAAEPPIRVAEPFDLAEVTLLDGPFLAAQERNKGYILRADVDRLMHWFRVNNGLPSSAEPYGPWKPNDYAQQGHFQGHYLSACALLYRNTGDARFKERLDRMVSQLAEVQAQHPSGYLSVFPESWMRHQAGLEVVPGLPRSLPQPWYAVHKVYAGLIDAYQWAGNTQALQVMTRCAAWIQSFTGPLSEEQMQRILAEEHGGMNEALANLHALTGDPAHLALARRFCHRAVMDPLAEGRDTLDTLHANTQVPKFTGFARLHELTGDAVYRDAATHFWRFVVHDRSYANGGNSSYEKFTPKASLSLSLSAHNTETCNTYNLLKLTRHLFAWTPRASLADAYERALLNHILSSQHPEAGTVAYFHSLQAGNRKGFSPGHVSFACCHGSGMENHAKYSDSIYFHEGGRRLFVNLFIASEVKWKDAGLTVRQVTRFPEEPGTTLTLRAAAPVTATLSLRKPAWAGPGFAVTVNGSPVPAAPGPDGYVDLNRTWKDGDTIVLTLPMTFRWEGFRDNPARAALMHGPVLLVAKTEPGNREAVVTAPPDRALASLQPAGKPLHFTGDPAVFTRGPGSAPARFLPMYQEYQDPYIAYWELRDPTAAAACRAQYAAEAERWTRLAPRTRDLVYFDIGTPSAASTMPGRLAADPALPRTPGTDRTEKDRGLEAHSGYNHQFNLPHRIIAGLWQTFRTAEVGSDRFSWNLAVEPGKPHTLLVRLWSPTADDPEARRATACSLEVHVSQAAAPTRGSAGTEATTEGNQLATGPGVSARPSTRLGVVGPAPADGTFRDVAFPLPATLIADQPNITVTFVRPPRAVAGLVAEVRILRD